MKKSLLLAAALSVACPGAAFALVPATLDWDGARPPAPVSPLWCRPQTFTSKSYKKRQHAERAMKLKVLELKMSRADVVKYEVVYNRYKRAWYFVVVYYDCWDM
jgi:hypothetical protein